MGGGGERSWGRVLGTWGHCLGDTVVTLPLCQHAACHETSTVPPAWGGGSWAYFPTPLPFAPSFPPSFPHKPFIPILTLVLGTTFGAFTAAPCSPPGPYSRCFLFFPMPPPLTIHPPVVWHCLLAPAGLLLGTARQHVRGHSTGVPCQDGGCMCVCVCASVGNGGHPAPFYLPCLFFILLNF